MLAKASRMISLWRSAVSDRPERPTPKKLKLRREGNDFGHDLAQELLNPTPRSAAASATRAARSSGTSIVNLVITQQLYGQTRRGRVTEHRCKRPSQLDACPVSFLGPVTGGLPEHFSPARRNVRRWRRELMPRTERRSPVALPRHRFPRRPSPSYPDRESSPSKAAARKGRPPPEYVATRGGVCVARWYDPGTGEFMSVDPDLAETDQPYAYASDDPVNEGDPSGDSVELCLQLASFVQPEVPRFSNR